MKKNWKYLLGVAVLGIMATSCSVVTTGAGMGVLYTDVTEGMAVTDNNLGTKVGVSSATGILGLVATGDAGINSAAKDGGIKKITHVDVKKTSILGLFASYKTIVYGN